MAPTPTVRYDGLADHYDDLFSHYDDPGGSPGADLVELLGPPTGTCLDIGCGTGLSGRALASAGWRVGGLDLSADQLRLAATRLQWVVRGDAHRLPFASASVDRVAAMFVHTDVDDFAAILREIARVLRPDGRVGYVGVHPCFVGHHIDSVTGSDERLGLGPGYREAGWVEPAGFDSDRFRTAGLRRHVGARHMPLADLLGGFVAAGLHLESVLESGDGLVPWRLGVHASKLA